MDSGSTKSILGKEGIELAAEFNQEIKPSEVKAILFPNGRIESVLGQVALPSTLDVVQKCVIKELTKTQMALVENFFNRELKASKKELGATHLAKHTIDVGDHPPIKQKYHDQPQSGYLGVYKTYHRLTTRYY